MTDDQAIDLGRRLAAPWAERAQTLAAAQVERQLPLLGELAEIGLDVARAVGRAAEAWSPPERVPLPNAAGPAGQGSLAQAEAEIAAAEAQGETLAESLSESRMIEPDAGLDDPEPPPSRRDASGIEGVALAYARVSRAVRLTVALQSKLVKDLEALHHAQDTRDRWKDIKADSAQRMKRAERKDAVAQVVLRVAYDEAPDQERAEGFVKAARQWMELDRYADLCERPMSEVVAQICKDLKLTPKWSRLVDDAWARAEIEGGAPGLPLREQLAPDVPRRPHERLSDWRRRRLAQIHAASP